jgi:hypothetical protein
LSDPYYVHDGNLVHVVIDRKPTLICMAVNPSRAKEIVTLYDATEGISTIALSEGAVEKMMDACRELVGAVPHINQIDPEIIPPGLGRAIVKAASALATAELPDPTE